MSKKYLLLTFVFSASLYAGGEYIPGSSSFIEGVKASLVNAQLFKARYAFLSHDFNTISSLDNKGLDFTLIPPDHYKSLFYPIPKGELYKDKLDSLIFIIKLLMKKNILNREWFKTHYISGRTSVMPSISRALDINENETAYKLLTLLLPVDPLIIRFYMNELLLKASQEHNLKIIALLTKDMPFEKYKNIFNYEHTQFKLAKKVAFFIEDLLLKDHNYAIACYKSRLARNRIRLARLLQASGKFHDLNIINSIVELSLPDELQDFEFVPVPEIIEKPQVKDLLASTSSTAQAKRSYCTIS